MKPLERDRFVSGVMHALEMANLRRENRALSEGLLAGSLKNPEIFALIITRNERMLSVFNYIEAIAPSLHPVLITGETGVGKELAARAIHIPIEITHSAGNRRADC